MSEDYGTAVCRRREDGSVALVQADDVICVSPDLLRDADPIWLQVDGDRLVICGKAFYVATGQQSEYGSIYRRVRNEGDL